jgi:hypothetical protein
MEEAGMAVVEFECPNASCRRMLHVPQEHVGKAARCPSCGTIVRVRAPAGAGLRKLSPLEEQVGQWIAAQADAVSEDIPDPTQIREAQIPSAGHAAGAEVAAEVAEEPSVYGGMARETVPRCPHCNHPVGRAMDICPYCGMYRREVDEKAGKRLAKTVRTVHRIRQMRVGRRRAFGGPLTVGASSVALVVLVIALGVGVGLLAFIFPPRGGDASGGIHGEVLAGIALGVIGLAGGLVSMKVSIRGRPRPMTLFILLVTAGWTYQATITVQMLLGWGQAYPPLQNINVVWGWGYASSLVVLGVAVGMILMMKRMGLAVLAVAVLAGIVLLHIMRGWGGGGELGYVPPFAYLNTARTLIAVVGLLKFSDLMND